MIKSRFFVDLHILSEELTNRNIFELFGLSSKKFTIPNLFFFKRRSIFIIFISKLNKILIKIIKVKRYQGAILSPFSFDVTNKKKESSFLRNRDK